MSEEVPESEPAANGSGLFARAYIILVFFMGAALIAWLLSGFYQVKVDEVAIVERLGEYLATPDGKTLLVEHGLHYHLPWPIDRLHVVSVQQDQMLTVNAFNVNMALAKYADLRESQKMPPQLFSARFDPYLITADKDVLHMEISFVYRVNDPEAWFNTVASDDDSTGGMQIPVDTRPEDREAMFQQVSQQAMIHEMARRTLERTIFEGAAEIPGALFNTIQDLITLHDTGGHPVSLGIELREQQVSVTVVKPPDVVKQAFDGVLQARAMRDSERTRADTDASAVKTAADAQRQTMLLEAEKDKRKTIAAAQGEADRFKQVLAEYEKAPDVARWNIFADAVRSIATNARRIVFAQPGGRVAIYVDPPKFDAGQSGPKQ